MTNKNRTPPEHEPAEERLMQGLALILSALPVLLIQWLANRNK